MTGFARGRGVRLWPIGAIAALGTLGLGARSSAALTLEREPYGRMPTGEAVERFTLRNDRGMTVRLIPFGATVTEVHVPDREGRSADVALGVRDLQAYLRGTRYMGCVVGRYGNRIAGARFVLDGTTYTLPANNGPNTLHGGPQGFYNVLWTAEPVREPDRVGVRFTYVSPDGDQGFPGTLTARVTYWLGETNELRIDYEAQTDKPTVVNLTNHTYWNLAGEASGSILDHELMLQAPFMLPVDATSIPTGEVRPVAGTPFDFRAPKRIGADIGPLPQPGAEPPAGLDEQLRLAWGYDHCFVLDKRAVGELTLAARVREPRSGRVMEVWTTEPGVQFYSGNKLDGTIVGKSGTPYGARSGFCLETQHFPDSPNHAHFPSTRLDPGRPFRSQTIYRFGVDVPADR